MKSRIIRTAFIPGILIALLLSLWATNATAVNLMFLSKESPAAKFSDADWLTFNRALDHTLANVEDGAAYHWNNPASPASGVMEMLESSMKDEQPCRRMRLTNSYNEVKGVSEFVFCKQPDGEWKVAQ